MNLPDHVYHDGKRVRRTRFNKKDLEGAKLHKECQPYVEFKFTANDPAAFEKKGKQKKSLADWFKQKSAVRSAQLEVKRVGSDFVVRLTTNWQGELAKILDASKQMKDPEAAADFAFEDWGNLRKLLKPQPDGKLCALENDLTRTHYRITFRTTQEVTLEYTLTTILSELFVKKFDWLDEGSMGTEHSLSVRIDGLSVIVDVFTFETREDFELWAGKLKTKDGEVEDSSEMIDLKGSLNEATLLLPKTREAFRYLSFVKFEEIDSP